MQVNAHYSNISSRDRNKLNVDKHAKCEEKEYALVVLQVLPTYNEDNTITIHYLQNTNIGTNNGDVKNQGVTTRIL